MEEFPGEPFNYEKFKEGAGFYFCNPSLGVKKKSLEEIGGYGQEGVDITDDLLMLRKWVEAGKKVDFQPGYAVCYHRCLLESEMSRIRGWKQEWVTK